MNDLKKNVGFQGYGDNKPAFRRIRIRKSLGWNYQVIRGV
jgi:hypothetical protein